MPSPKHGPYRAFLHARVAIGGEARGEPPRAEREGATPLLPDLRAGFQPSVSPADGATFVSFCATTALREADLHGFGDGFGVVTFAGVVEPEGASP